MSDVDKRLFIEEVIKMRCNQKRYFATRDIVSLVDSKKSEKIVDDLIKQWQFNRDLK